MSEPIKKLVTDWLNDVDYAAEDGYVPSDFALEFVNFIKLVNGDKPEEHKTPVVHYKMLDLVPGSEENLINLCSRGLSKALALDTLLLTPNGHVPIGDILVGDRVIDRTGKPTTVTNTSKVFYNQTYTVRLTDGSEFVANEDHIHIVQRRTSKTDKTKPRLPSGRYRTKNIWTEEQLTTSEILKLGVVAKRKVTARTPRGRDLKWYIPVIDNPVEFDAEGSPLDPYTVGVILGDGTIDKITGSTRVTSHIDDVRELQSHIPYETSGLYHDSRRPETTLFSIRKIGPLVKTFIGTETTWTKAIPQQLLFGSIEDRIAVLQGLMDTDGTIATSGHASFTSASKQLAYGVVHIVKSLGGNARIRAFTNDYAGYWSVQIHLNTINPFRLQRKAERWTPNQHYLSGNRVGIESIEATPVPVPSRCISVDSPTESYLIEGSIVTHNTTVMAEYMYLYLAVYGGLPDYGNIDYALYVSDAIENGVKKMRLRLERKCQNSTFLKEYLQEFRFTDVRWYFKNNNGDELVVTGHGAKSGVRGTVELGTRPQLAILDDLLSDDDARSPTVIASIENTIYKAIDFALHPQKRKIIWSGTPFNAKDPLYKAVESGAWHVNVYPICNYFPCSEAEFVGAWEDRFPYSYVKAKYDKLKKLGNVAAFNQELMLRIMSEDDRLILDSDIQWFNRRKMMTLRGAFNFYITTDFATSEKESADYSGISVWAYNNRGSWFWVDGICKRQTMDKNIDDLFRLAQEYKPQQVGIEVSGQQGGFIPWIQTEMINRNIYFTLASEGNKSQPGIRPTTNKMVRFNLVVPWFKSKKMYFPEDKKETFPVVEILDELSLASPSGFRSKHDDMIDTISMLASLTAWKPSEIAVPKFDDELDLWEHDEKSEISRMDSYVV